MRHTIKKSVILPILLLVVVASSIYPIETAFAASPTLYVRQSLINDMRPSLLGMALAECLASELGLADGSWNFLGLSGRDQISTSHAESGQWYGVPAGNSPINDAHVSYVLPPNVGFTHCSDAGFISSAVKAVGFDSNIGALCGLDFGRINGTDCSGVDDSGAFNGSGGFKQLHHLSFDTYYGMMKTLGKAGDLTDPQLYLFYMESMVLACGAKISDTPGDAAYTWFANVVDSSGVITYVSYIGTAKASDGRDIAGAPNMKGVTCSDMAKKAKPYAKAYSDYVIVNKDIPDATKPVAGATDSATTPGATGTSTCSSDMGGIGWILCPVLGFLATINDTAYKFISDAFLSFDSGMLTDSTVTETWGTFRNIANVAFVIVFMIIILSQVTSLGVSSYGVKKMMPRIIIAAVLVNMSLIVCQLAVDLSNVVGFGVSNLFGSLSPGGGGMGLTNNVTWINAVGVALAAGGALVAILMSLAALPSALLAIGAVVLILIARKAIIIILVILAPLAFVAYLLPNTETLFKKWYKLFFSMLILFPVVGMVFGASRLAANIIAGTLDMSTAADPAKNNIIKLTALIVSVVPFFIVPGMLKSSLNATGKIGAALSGLSSKANSRFSNRAKSDTVLGRGLASGKSYRDSRRAVRQTKALGRWYNAPFAAVTGGINGIGNARQAKSRAQSVENEEFEKAVKENSVGYSQRASGDVLKDYQSGKLNNAQKAAAIEHIMAKGSFNERKALVESVDGNMSGALKKRISDGVYSKGDQSIYGTAIGSKIMAGTVGGEKGLREKTLANIENGHVTADHLVQGEGSAKYLIDVAMGETDKIDKATGKAEVDPATGKPTGAKVDSSVAGTAGAQGQLSGSIAEAQTNTKTRASANAGAFASEFGRI